MTPATAHQEYLARPYFPALDGLRALSIALVVIWHATETDYFGWLHGFHGVTIFFVLSGFLITTLLLREEDRHGTVSFRGFYLRRVFRILPLYYLVLAVYCVLILGLGLQPDRVEAFQRALPYYTFYFSEYPHYARFRVRSTFPGPLASRRRSTCSGRRWHSDCCGWYDPEWWSPRRCWR